MRRSRVARFLANGLPDKRDGRPALPSTFPTYNTLMVFGDRIWVKHFRRPGEPEHQWLAFDADGTQVATMFLPSRFVAQQIGSDWVLVLIADELGVERLVVYALVEDP